MIQAFPNAISNRLLTKSDWWIKRLANYLASFVWFVLVLVCLGVGLSWCWFVLVLVA